MNELSIEQFADAIRSTHKANAELAGSVKVEEAHEGRPVWSGSVLIFDLYGHSTASKCYAWSVDGRVTAVLHEGPVDSPQAAVRAAIASEYR